MPKRFQQEGYNVFAAVKIFHNGKGINETHIPNYAGQFGSFGPMPDEKISTYPGHPLWDWGVYPERDDQMPDYQIASWAVQKLAKNKTTRKGTIFWELALRVTNLMRSPQKGQLSRMPFNFYQTLEK
ncbi:hypothetical protein SAMN03080602_01375 [Arenibacter troitsensis]|uniref:Uncharacterized protein n=1 Tax=Arenibacter troitsensis TaxID=188872 RepID=A0A1X7J2U0_9FLAO|nr:hypothetical protein SAMN03080602_01375 [Arenibacter troitsensis]